ncbi:MAG: pyridoxamine 5'-phosphate oxidase family protein [Thermomicrobiales bacterium]
MSSPPDWAVDFVREARVARLATANAGAEPHVIPCVYVLHDGAIYSVIDEKPKSGRRLLRLRNIDATGRAALVVDHYDDDWTQLAFVLIRGWPRRSPPTIHAIHRRWMRYGRSIPSTARWNWIIRR